MDKISDQQVKKRGGLLFGRIQFLLFQGPGGFLITASAQQYFCHVSGLVSLSLDFPPFADVSEDFVKMKKSQTSNIGKQREHERKMVHLSQQCCF